MSKLYNISRISGLWSYTIEDICNMYSMHPQTVRKWIKIGLRTIDSKKPSLIHGSDLKEFLKKHNEKLKKHLDFEEFLRASTQIYQAIEAEVKVGKRRTKERKATLKKR